MKPDFVPHHLDKLPSSLKENLDKNLCTCMDVPKLDIINAIVLAIYNAAGTLFTITTVSADGTVVVSQVFIEAS